MPLIVEEPPRPLPRATSTRRSLMLGSGWDQKPQLKRGMFMGICSAVGICTNMLSSLPPYSSRRTELPASSVRRLARTHPADPAPTMMKSNDFSISLFPCSRHGAAWQQLNSCGQLDQEPSWLPIRLGAKFTYLSALMATNAIENPTTNPGPVSSFYNASPFSRSLPTMCTIPSPLSHPRPKTPKTGSRTRHEWRKVGK